VSVIKISVAESPTTKVIVEITIANALAKSIAHDNIANPVPTRSATIPTAVSGVVTINKLPAFAIAL
jgi:hypothetical protein